MALSIFLLYHTHIRHPPTLLISSVKSQQKAKPFPKAPLLQKTAMLTLRHMVKQHEDTHKGPGTENKSELRFQTPSLFMYCSSQAGWLPFFPDNTLAVTKSGYNLSDTK